MAFKKLHAKSGSRKLDVPAITVAKSMCTLNKAFCEEIGLEVTGDLASMDLFYDEDTNKFGISIYKDSDKGARPIKYNKSHQAQLYLRSMFKQEGYRILSSETIKVKWNKKHKMWLFELDDRHKIKEEEATVKVLKNKRKRKEKRNKRKKSELGRKV
jgi:hypothetical protein